MSHDDASELLGAYALDAVDGEELLELEAHLTTCPRCRSELDSLREVAGGIGNSVEPLPEGLWSTIASRLPERQEEDEPPPMPRLVGQGRTPFRPPPDASRRRRSRTTAATLGAIAVAAAAVAVVLGIGLVRADNRVSGLQSAAAHPPTAVAAALHAPGHKVVDLTTTTHARMARFVVLPDGRGFLVSATLPRPAQHRDVPAVGNRGDEAGLPRRARRRPAAGRVHHGGIDASIAAQHHGRAVRRFGGPEQPHPGHGDCLSPGASC